MSRVLIVDDDPSIRRLLTTLAKREGIQADSAADGGEAIALLRTHSYAIVLLDLMMPRVDGHGVLQFLERERQAPSPWVIVMTAAVQTAVETIQSRPVYRVLPKPFDIRDLIQHVRELQSPAP